MFLPHNESALEQAGTNYKKCIFSELRYEGLFDAVARIKHI